MGTVTELERKVNAENLSIDELINLFEPNNDIRPNSEGAEQFCSYDRVADPEAAYYLVAERGVGKTHILRLLEEQLKNSGHIALTIGFNESEILTNFKRLQKKYPKEVKPNIWLLAILEEVEIKLFDIYIDTSFFPSFAYKMVALTLTKNLLSRYKEFFDYLKDYRPDAWEKLSKKLKLKTTNFRRFIPNIRVSLPIIGHIDFRFDRLEFTEAKSKDKIESEIGTRINYLASSLWATLNSRKKAPPISYYGEQNLFIRRMPTHQGVYIIADGLDQGDNPLNHQEILGLVSAINLLNQRAAKHLDKKPNFKAIMALRSITYDYVVGVRFTELEHIRPHVEKLIWSPESIRRFMARRILKLSSDIPLSDEQVSESLKEHFPDPIHYFGKDFESAVDFVFTVTKLRPRQVLLYWQICANKTDAYQDRPYQATLSADHLTEGLKTYALEVATDIAKEYDLEYKGLFELLRHLAANSQTIHRISTRKNLVKNITAYLSSPSSDNQRPEWMQKSPLDILNILYQVGVIGLPIYVNIRDKKIDWLNTWYVNADPYKSVNAYDTIVIHPSFWNWITDVHIETLLRRRYLFNLYDSYSNSIQALQSSLQNILFSKYSLRNEHEEHIGRFLVMTKFVLEYAIYPETIDAKLAKDIVDRTSRSLEIFSGTVFCPAEKSELRRFKVTEMADFYSKTMLDHIPTYRRNNIKYNENTKFIENKNGLEQEYRERIVSPWLSGHVLSSTEYDMLERFYGSLVSGSDSLSSAIKNSIEYLKDKKMI